MLSGNVELQLSHCVPDLIHKCLAGQNPLRIFGAGNQVRSYSNGADIARGIVMAMESPAAINEDFNISTNESHTVLELAKLIWERINPSLPFSYESDPAYEHDVQIRQGDTSKAEKLLKFKALIPLTTSLDEVIEWVRNNIREEIGA